MPEQDNTPQHSQGFGPAEDSDASRQAQHSQSNDSPTDVNMNAVLARSQAQSTDQSYRNFLTNQDFRDKIMTGKLSNAG
jgi:hypothetical protein